jgi:hypothetical protein
MTAKLSEQGHSPVKRKASETQPNEPTRSRTYLFAEDEPLLTVEEYEGDVQLSSVAFAGYEDPNMKDEFVDLSLPDDCLTMGAIVMSPKRARQVAVLLIESAARAEGGRRK